MAAALPAVCVLLLYWPALSASFQFDDWNVIVGDPRVHSLAAWWESMPGIRPLLKLSYALNYLAGSEPVGFRVVNVLIHAINSVLVFQLLRVKGRRLGLLPDGAWQAALLAALLFAAHPVQTEAVTYISGRSSSLAALFCLVSLFCWMRSEDSASSRAMWMTGCCLSFAAAVASKETALILPLACWLYSADRPARDTLRRLVPLMVAMLAFAILALSLPKYRYLLEFSVATRSLTDNLLTQSRALLYLLGQLLRPSHGNADPSLPALAGFDAASAGLMLGWVVTLVVALRYVRRKPVASFAVLWFLLWLAPTNSLLPRLDVANDRQLYVAMIGPAWWLSVSLLAWTATSTALRNFFAALLLVLLGLATLERNRIYDTEVTFWQDTATRNPQSARAANNLGMAYAIECRLDDALSEFERAIALEPEDFRARINRRLLFEGQLPGVDWQRCASDIE